MYNVKCLLPSPRIEKNAYIEANLKFVTKKPSLEIIVSSQSPQLLATRLMPGATICVGLATNSAMFIKCQRLPLRHCSEVWLLTHNDFEARLEEEPPADRTVLRSIIKHDQNRTVLSSRSPLLAEQYSNSRQPTVTNILVSAFISMIISICSCPSSSIRLHLNICCFALCEWF